MSGKKAVTIKVRKDRLREIKKKLKELAKYDLLVGVPQEKSERKQNVQGEEASEPITNAELMFIHSNGSPARNIPKRPTIEPTIEENQKTISEKFKKIAQSMLDNKSDGKEELEKLGIWVVNKIKARFGSDELAPLKEATIKAKGSDRPLIDTGQLRNSVTYIVRNKQ